MKKNKPDCYACRWRGHVPGSAHSKCCHPYNVAISNDPMLKMLGMFASVGRVSLSPMADDRLNIKANSHGIKSGWFHYPFDFDPVWLDNCDGFEKIATKDARVLNKDKAKNIYNDATTCEQPYFCDDCSIRFKCFSESKKPVE